MSGSSWALWIRTWKVEALEYTQCSVLMRVPGTKMVVERRLDASGRTTRITTDSSDHVSHQLQLRWSRSALRSPSFKLLVSRRVGTQTETSSQSVPNVSVDSNSCSSQVSSVLHVFPMCQEVRHWNLQGLVRLRRPYVYKASKSAGSLWDEEDHLARARSRSAGLPCPWTYWFHGESRSQFARRGCLCRPYEDRFVPRCWSLVGYTLKANWCDDCWSAFTLRDSGARVFNGEGDKDGASALGGSGNANLSAPCRRASKVPRRRFWITIFMSSTCLDRHLYFFNGQLQHQHFGPFEGDEKHCLRWKHRTI